MANFQQGDVSNRTRLKQNTDEKDSAAIKQSARINNVVERDENNAAIEPRRSRRVRNVVNSRLSNRVKRKNSPQYVDERKVKNIKKEDHASSLESHEVNLQSVKKAIFEESEEEREEVSSHTSDGSIVHPIYRMQRPERLSRRLTSGIAPHDEEEKENVLEVANYVSDLFQNLYESEVSAIAKPLKSEPFYFADSKLLSLFFKRLCHTRPSTCPNKTTSMQK